MDILNFDSYLKSLKSIEFLPFFIEYLNQHQYVNSIKISRDFLREKIKLSHYNTHFNQLSRTLTYKFVILVKEAMRLRVLIKSNTKFFKVINRKKLNLKMISNSLKNNFNIEINENKNLNFLALDT